MTCVSCLGHREASVKCLFNVLDSFKQHVLMLQKSSLEDAQTISSLQSRNDKLHKALELLKQRQQAMHLHVDKRRKVSPKKFRPKPETPEVSPLPQSQNSLNMNIALNSIEISEEEGEKDDEDESIAETESATKRTPRKLRRKENIRPDCSWLGKNPTPQNISLKPKINLSLTRRGSQLKQTRLHFDVSKNKDPDIIEDSPNLFNALKQAKQSRSLLDKTDTGDAIASSSNSNNKTCAQPLFDLNETEPTNHHSNISVMAPPPALPPIKSDSESLILLTPATQDIVFLDDSSSDEMISNLGTMDLMAEVMKEDDSTALKRYEKKMIEKQKQNPAPVPAPAPAMSRIKAEPQTQLAEAAVNSAAEVANESTKLPEDIEKYMLDMLDEENQHKQAKENGVDEDFPRPLIIKPEPEITLKEKYNIECAECEKLINYMGSNLNEAKILEYLRDCRHYNERSTTPPGFWNPHMVSFDSDDPRNEVLLDMRFKKDSKATK